MTKRKAFTRDGDRRFLYSLGDSKWPWQDYSGAYHQAASVIMNYVRDDPNERSSLSYPIFYLLRHSIELQLKELHYFAQSYHHEGRSVPNVHKLTQLWGGVKSFVDMIFLEGDGINFSPLDPGSREEYKITIQQIQDVVEELDEIDATSTAFRYPFNRDGSSSFARNPAINLETSFERVQKLIFDLHFFLNYIVEQMGPQFPGEAA